MSTEYTKDVEYTNKFYGELSPIILNYVATLNRQKPINMSSGFTYCELGCGNGMSTNVLAAANPEGTFYGIDFNGDHVRTATETANRGGLSNITFLEESFENLGNVGLPKFDFITMHGVYSWISDHMRKAVRDFVAEYLKPGGVFLITYNTYPGWSAIAPIREFMRAYAVLKGGTIVEQAQNGLEYLKFLRDNNVAFFQANPSALGILNDLEKQDIRYVCHEFFTPYWQPFYFRQVWEDMQSIGLTFSGLLPYFLNYGDVCLPDNLQDFFQSANDRLTFETHKDFVRNTSFRWDVYTKPTEDGLDTSAERFLDFHFGTTMSPGNFKLEVQHPGCRVLSLTGPAYPVLLSALANGSTSARDLLALPELASFQADDILTAVTNLVLADQVRPSRARYERREDVSNGFELSAFNRAILEDFLFKQDVVTLASPIFGSGVNVRRDDALMIWAIAEAGVEGIHQWVEDKLRENNFVVEQNENSLSLQAKIDQFLLSIHFWLGIGVLEYR